MIQFNLNNEGEVYSSLNLDPHDRIYFHRDTENMKVYEIVNYLLTPYGFEPFSENQFKRVAGGFVHSSNLIRNYASGRGRIKNGYAICSNIIQYCKEVHSNSVFIPFENVLEELYVFSCWLIYFSQRRTHHKTYKHGIYMDIP